MKALLLAALLTAGCAASAPPPACPALPPMAYFGDVAKPLPPREGMREFLLYVDSLSRSWDGIYGDRLKAREYMEKSK